MEIESIVKASKDKELFLLLSYVKELGLKPGDRLPSIKEIAAGLKMNASQVRSSLIKASALGIVETHPRSGTYLRGFEFSRLQDLFSLMIAVGDGDSRFRLIHIHDLKTILEKGTFAAAALRATDEELCELRTYIDESEKTNELERLIDFDEKFHLAVARMSRNPFSVALLSVINGLLRKDRLENANYMATKNDTLNEHRMIHESIKTRNIEEAMRLAEHHGDRRKKLLMDGASR